MQHLSKRKADWENLFPELLASIAKRLTSIWDYISFRGVCKSWRSASTFDNFDHAFPQVPWLVFTEKGSDTKFLDLSNNKKVFRIANLPNEGEKSILSCSGWLLCVVEGSVRNFLTHPIRRIRIELPDLDTFPGYKGMLSGSFHFAHLLIMLSKMVLSGSPTIVSDLVIMVIWGRKKQLGFSRPGDSSWTTMESWDGSFTDILYHNKKLYAIDDKLRVVECDIHGPNPTRIQLLISTLPGFDHVVKRYMCNYMVESSGKFLIVLIYFYRGLVFRAFEFDLMDGSHKEIYDLGNRTLFVSSASSSVCIEGFAWNNEVEPNCIYQAFSGRGFHLGKTDYNRFLDDQISHSRFGNSTWIVPGF